MKTNFISFQYGLDFGSIGGGGGGGTGGVSDVSGGGGGGGGGLLGGLAKLGVGVWQTISGAKNTKKYQRGLESLVNSYKPNAGIMDYYNKALARYSANPYTSSLYNQQTQNINRNVAAGIGALKNRRSAVGGISSLVQGQNDAQLKAASQAEQMQGQQLGLLGQATRFKAQEEYKPFEMKYNLMAQRASGANKTLGAGLQNVIGGLGSLGAAVGV